MHDSITVIRTCTVCGSRYLGGTYGEHRTTHPRRVTETQARVLALLADGHTQSEVARIVGVTRQRVNAIARGKGEAA
jgi:DNA-binding NarL/FixJ family response regulator